MSARAAACGGDERDASRATAACAGGRSAVIAMGKLGGREMTAGSDLDLILIYDHDADAEISDGERPLSVSQYFARLTQRLIAAVSAPTAEGVSTTSTCAYGPPATRGRWRPVFRASRLSPRSCLDLGEAGADPGTRRRGRCKPCAMSLAGSSRKICAGRATRRRSRPMSPTCAG